jgi:hypothetical protein
MSNCKNCNLGPTPLPLSGANCGITNTNPLTSTGNCSLDANGNPIVTPTATGDSGCVMTPNGLVCPENITCSPFDLSQQVADSCIVNSVVAESIAIGGAPLNVYKLLGVHEQTLLVDLVGNGAAISSGDMPNFPAKNAFDKFITEWRSQQTGTNVLAKAFIGYDFGNFKLDNARVRYGIETAIKQDISTIRIKQGCDPKARVTKIRVERSNDGVKWFGAALLNVPDCDGLVTLNFNRTVPSRYWRIRPLAFSGGPSDYWVVQALQLSDFEATSIKNIQDRIFLENRDRDYAPTPIAMKCSYTPLDVVTNSTKWGMSQSDTDRYILDVSFTQTVAALGRPFVIGDIIQLPSETQYRPDLTPVLKYLQIDDVAWATTGFTANWVPTLQRLIATPAIASQENQNVFGKMTEDADALGTIDIDNGQNPIYQDMSAINDTIEAEANTAVPERGEDTADMTQLSQDVYDFAAKHPNMQFPKRIDRTRNTYAVDALPPNGLPFTQGDTWPKNPKNGDYHRLTYSKSGKDIPARLYRWSNAKLEWTYLETDRRHESNNTKPYLQEFLNPTNHSVSVPVDKEFKPQ